ncbi:MAG: hypothetical protein KDA45_15945, partial [Planctomycetales bacterium]|nr:hypothetical protein [Planctomycetales bacterium]
SKPSVPAFTCLVYVRKNEDATVSGRVANLAGIEARGSSERDVLSRLAREFKARIVDMMSRGQPIPWVEPPASPGVDEHKRTIPVHL